MANSLSSRLDNLPIVESTALLEKDSAAGYLKQYRQHQRQAVSRRLLPRSSVSSIANEENPSEAPTSYDSDEVLLAQLHYSRDKALKALYQLQNYLSTALRNLLSRRWSVWIKNGLLSFLASAILATLLKNLTTPEPKSLHFSSTVLRSLIPLIPYPIAATFIGIHEHRISCTRAASARIAGLSMAVEASDSISKEDVEWICAERWDGVDLH